MRHIALVLITLLILACTSVSQAQEPILLSLETSSTSPQTGQTYVLNIRLEGVSELWLAALQIHYDPNMLYIMGTKAGSPVQQATLFNPGSSAVIQNQVQSDLILYTISLLAPAEPVSGDGILASFRIYPLQSGQTQIIFSQADMAKSLFEMRDGQRVGVGSESLSVSPILLDLTITGENVEPPSEATATPVPTEVPVVATQNFPMAQATLVNVTAAPRTPDGLATLEAPSPNIASGSSLVLIPAIGLTLLGAAGLLIMFFIARRRQ